jgi:hypothetical protein
MPKFEAEHGARPGVRHRRERRLGEQHERSRDGMP